MSLSGTSNRKEFSKEKQRDIATFSYSANRAPCLCFVDGKRPSLWDRQRPSGSSNYGSRPRPVDETTQQQNTQSEG